MSTGPARFPYHDATLPVEQRIDDLLSRMEPADKAGLMFQPMSSVGDLDAPGVFGMPAVAEPRAGRGPQASARHPGQHLH
jgi:beta-glucosidase